VSEAVDPGRLREIPLFAGLEDEALARVAGVAAELECPAGMVLTQADDAGSGMYVLEVGTVVVEARGGFRAELGPGEFVGELSLLVPDAHRVANVRTLTEVRCLAIGRQEFAELLEQEPRIALAMLPVLARRLVDVMTLAR
jgi:CRP/FNR family transcriptional regulator, cyclic AMP receptor protein